RPPLSSKPSSLSVRYPVFLTSFHLGMQDPHASGPETPYNCSCRLRSRWQRHSPSGDGWYQFSPRDVCYYPNLSGPPEQSETSYSKFVETDTEPTAGSSAAESIRHE